MAKRHARDKLKMFQRHDFSLFTFAWSILIFPWKVNHQPGCQRDKQGTSKKCSKGMIFYFLLLLHQPLSFLEKLTTNLNGKETSKGQVENVPKFSLWEDLVGKRQVAHLELYICDLINSCIDLIKCQKWGPNL